MTALATALRAAAEGAGVGLLGVAVAVAVFHEPELRRGVGFGVATAWFVSSVSVSWLLWSRERSVKAFWRAFMGGMALRVGTLGGLAALTWRREDLPAEALLLSYVFGVLGMLLTMETRHFKSR